MDAKEENLSAYKTDWSLWEMYKVDGRAIKDYESSIKKLIKIKSLQDFYELALYVPHLRPSQLFYDKESRSKAKYKITVEDSEEMVQIDSICLFRSEIPPLIEHSKNLKGGAHYYIFYDMKVAQMDQMWLSLSSSLVTGDGIPQSQIGLFEKINGVRFCDKSKPKEGTTQYRLEVWTESDYYQAETLAAHNQSKKDIEKIIKESGLDVKHSYKPHMNQD